MPWLVIWVQVYVTNLPAGQSASWLASQGTGGGKRRTKFHWPVRRKVGEQPVWLLVVNLLSELASNYAMLTDSNAINKQLVRENESREMRGRMNARRRRIRRRRRRRSGNISRWAGGQPKEDRWTQWLFNGANRWLYIEHNMFTHWDSDRRIALAISSYLLF